MKIMVTLIKEINQRLMESIEQEVKLGKDIEVKDHFGKYSMDTIASCVFGVDAQSFTDKESQFVENAKRVFRRSWAENIMLALFLVPGVVRLKSLLKIPMFKVRNNWIMCKVVMLYLYVTY